MEQNKKDFSGVFSLRTRIFLGSISMLLVLLVMVSAWTIPFLFESPSIFYKFGIYKTLLRSGKVLGLTAATLLFFQVVLVSRLRLLDRIFSLNRLYNFHRINGVIIACLAMLHPFCIIAAEKFTLFPFEKRYWPEFLGTAVLVVLVFIVITAIWRPLFGIAYELWRQFHRTITPAATAAMTIHILYVSETFTSGPPRFLVLTAAACNLLLFLRLWARRLIPLKKRFVVDQVREAGRDAYSVEVKPYKGEAAGFMPGQFVFITPLSNAVPGEEHPFTIASTPSRPDSYQFVIRALGDWTRRTKDLRSGEHVFIDGPYGLFSLMTPSGNEPLIMIAGGIGITPMLSMLRYLADTDDQRKILLIWSNRTRKHIIFPDEFADLERRLPGLRIVHVITGEKNGGEEPGRLDLKKLERLLDGWSRKAKVFLCGPPGMMRDVSRSLKKIGFSSAAVYKEEFQL